MASVRKKGLYEEDDRVEEFLMNQVAKFIRYEKLGLFAKDIKIKERELEIIMAPNYLNPYDRIAKVLDLWYQSLPRLYKVKDFMMDVNQWFDEGYVDRDIWNHLQKYVNADVLPVSTSTTEERKTRFAHASTKELVRNITDASQFKRKVQVERRGPVMSPESYLHEDKNLTSFSDKDYFHTHGAITAIAVSEGYTGNQNNVIGIQVKYGDTWGPQRGRPNWQNRTIIDLEHNDFITEVKWREGLATDMMTFKTHKGKKFGPYGNDYGGSPTIASASGHPLLYIEGAVHSKNFNLDWNGTIWKLTFFFAKY